MTKKIAIIGGGLAGMSAGIYGRLQGYETHVFESHSLCGGVCTGWKRKGYTFDGCFHWWTGSVPESPFYRFFQDVGIFPGTETVSHEIFSVLRREGKEDFIISTDVDRLCGEFLKIAPEDKDAVLRFGELVKNSGELTSIPMDVPMETFSPLQAMKYFSRYGQSFKVFKELLSISACEYAEREFSNDRLKDVFANLFWPTVPLMILVMTLHTLHIKDGTFPIGGAVEFMKKIESRYADLGGDISYNTPVKRILVEKRRAVGVELADGTVFKADWVISAADGYSTIYKMLDGKYVNKTINRLYHEHEVFKPLVQVSFGVDADLCSLPHSFQVHKEMSAEGFTIGGFNIKHYCFDPTLAPEGKSVVIALIEVRWEDWKDLKRDSHEYLKAKALFERLALTQAEKVYPGIKGKIEVADTATPLTYVRYTHAWKASYEGWLPNKENLMARIPKQLPRLKNFVMAGQWVEAGGGIPTAVLSGRNAVYIVSHGDKAGWKEPER